jgi:hypothetical protein
MVFAACLLVVFLLPYVGFFLNSSLLFFAPQMLFPYEGLVVRKRAVFSHHVALWLAFLQWSLAAAGFAWLARRMSIGHVILAAIGMIVIIGIITNVVFALFGASVELDGP